MAPPLSSMAPPLGSGAAYTVTRLLRVEGMVYLSSMAPTRSRRVTVYAAPDPRGGAIEVNHAFNTQQTCDRLRKYKRY